MRERHEYVQPIQTLPTDIVREIRLSVPPEQVVLQVENDNGSLAFVTRLDLPPGVVRVIGRSIGVDLGAANTDLALELWQAATPISTDVVGEVVHIRAGRRAFVADIGLDFVPEVVSADEWSVPDYVMPDEDGRRLNIVIEAPLGVALRLGAVCGNIEVQKAATSGDIAVASGSGVLRISQARANGVIVAQGGSGIVYGSDLRSPTRLELRSGSGNVQAHGVVSPVVVMISKSGSVRLAGHTWTPDGALLNAPALLALRSGSGRVEADGVEATELHMESRSGSVAFRGQLVAQQRCRIRTDTGSITIRLRASSAAEIAAQSGSGRVALGAGADDHIGVRRIVTQSNIVARFGKGGAPLEIESRSGSIIIGVE